MHIKRYNMTKNVFMVSPQKKFYYLLKILKGTVHPKKIKMHIVPLACICYLSIWIIFGVSCSVSEILTDCRDFCFFMRVGSPVKIGFSISMKKIYTFRRFVWKQLCSAHASFYTVKLKCSTVGMRIKSTFFGGGGL